MSAPAVDDLEATNADAVLRYLRVFETYDLDELAKVVDPDVIGHGAGQTAVGRRVIEESDRASTRHYQPLPADADAGVPTGEGLLTAGDREAGPGGVGPVP
jgi:hypothetical protein